VPAELSSFVGRKHELSEVRRLLASARLVTLTGVGGVGKSRLAVRVAGQVRRAFPDGVWFVELAGLQDPLLVPQAVSEALGIRDQSDRDPVEVLADFLADRQVLLVVDNCEHLAEASALLVADLLRAAPGVRVLATSREVLKVPGEHVYPVAPLLVPDPAEPVAAGAGVKYPGLVLFAERAAAVRPGFAVTGENAAAVARVCQRLDGIPLALELAAARLGALSVEQLAAQLDDRFRLLATGNRAALPRHRTLRAAVEWSFELCTKPERVLWVRASVFAGRFDLDAAGQVCGGDGLAVEEVYEVVAGLVDKSVLIAEEHAGEFRYRLLDTIRDYGLDRLRDPDETDGLAVLDEEVLRLRHRDYYLDLAERFDADWFGPRQAEWTERMRAEHANLRAALSYCLAGDGGSAAPGAEEARSGVRLAGALYYFWYGCGEVREGRYWLERALAADPHPSRERTRALSAYCWILIMQGAPAAVADPARECIELARRFGQPLYQAEGLQTLGLSLLYREDLVRARAALEEAVAVAGELGATHPAVAHAEVGLGVAVMFQGDPVRAAELFAESEAISRLHDEQWSLAATLRGAIMPALALGQVAAADAYGRESVRLSSALHDTMGAATGLEFLAWVAAAAHDHPRTACLLGAADRQLRDIGAGALFSGGGWARSHQDCETAARQALGDAAYDTAHRRGSELNFDEAVAYALGEEKPAAEQPPERGELPSLTRREREVAELVGQGLSNKEIAARLVIAQRTAESHVDKILTKLGFSSRAQVAAWYATQRKTAD
jgi:predicted ATPase/DNA-binding NarL/FixJ family response regulator